MMTKYSINNSPYGLPTNPVKRNMTLEIQSFYTNALMMTVQQPLRI